MELLLLLLQRHGELVSREEIRAHLWKKDVFLDVDHSINTAIRKVRRAARDEPCGWPYLCCDRHPERRLFSKGAHGSPHATPAHHAAATTKEAVPWGFFPATGGGRHAAADNWTGRE